MFWSTCQIQQHLDMICDFCHTMLGADLWMVSHSTPSSACCRGQCRINPSPCWAYGCLDDFPTIQPNIACCFIVQRNSSWPMSGLYCASSTAEIRLEARTFRKTIAYTWNCWIVDSACCCTCIGTNILSKIFQILKLVENNCSLLSRWSFRSTAFLSLSIKPWLTKQISYSDRFLRIAFGS